MVRILVSVLVLVGKTPGLLLSLVYRRRVGARTFRHQLLRAGLRPEDADELTLCYRKLLPGWQEWRGIRSTQISTRQRPIEPFASHNPIPFEQRTSRGFVFRYGTGEKRVRH